MLTEKQINLLKAAKRDKVFQEEFKVHEPTYYKLFFFSDSITELLYMTVYMGWLIGKGTYNEQDFK